MANISKKENFIIQFNKQYAHDIRGPLSCKRVIFVSLIGLFQSYNQCPPYVLHSALFLVPLQKQWIYSPSKFMDEIQEVSSGLIRKDKRGQRFFELMKWKDSQGLVLWANDAYEVFSAASKHHPFWQFVSRTLVSLHDPITSLHYKPLPEPVDDQTFWNKEIEAQVRGTCTAIDIVSELYFKSLNYEPMKVIFTASNPGSLEVITSYNIDANGYHHHGNEYVKMIMTDLDEEKTANDEWWILPDYFD